MRSSRLQKVGAVGLAGNAGGLDGGADVAESLLGSGVESSIDDVQSWAWWLVHGVVFPPLAVEVADAVEDFVGGPDDGPDGLDGFRLNAGGEESFAATAEAGNHGAEKGAIFVEEADLRERFPVPVPLLNLEDDFLQGPALEDSRLFGVEPGGFDRGVVGAEVAIHGIDQSAVVHLDRRDVHGAAMGRQLFEPLNNQWPPPRGLDDIQHAPTTDACG